MGSRFLNYGTWTSQDGAQTSAGVQPFVFGKLVTRSDWLPNPLAKLSKLATIEVQNWRTRQIGIGRIQPVAHTEDSFNEKEAKKGKLICDRITR